MKPVDELPPLTEADRARAEWQMWVPDVGEEGQRRLKAARVLISRVGGIGGLVAHELACAGIGTLVLAHAGNLKPGDLNRQTLMRHDAIGTPRLDCALATLHSVNPDLELIGIAENATEANAEKLVSQADVVVCCAPLFPERFLLNRAAVRQGKPFINCAMYELTGQISSTLPGVSACLACRTPEAPPDWKRQFPVFGAVSGTVGCIGAMEAIKIVCGIGEPLYDRLLSFDLRDMRFRVFHTKRRPDCAVCGNR